MSLLDRFRPIAEPQWPNGGFTFTRQCEYQYDVNAFGSPVASNELNGWARGDIIRGYQVKLHPSPIGLFPYDPTDPSTWHQPQI